MCPVLKGLIWETWLGWCGDEQRTDTHWQQSWDELRLVKPDAGRIPTIQQCSLGQQEEGLALLVGGLCREQSRVTWEEETTKDASWSITEKHLKAFSRTRGRLCQPLSLTGRKAPLIPTGILGIAAPRPAKVTQAFISTSGAHWGLPWILYHMDRQWGLAS